VIYGNKMYIFGGEDAEGNTNDFFLFDFSLMKWARVTDAKGSPPDSRSYHSYVLVTSIKTNPLMAIYGGYSDDGFSRELIFFDFIDNRWKRPIAIYDNTSDLPTAR
jgi:hypothetical protein